MINDNWFLTLLVIAGTAVLLWVVHQLLMGLLKGDEDVRTVMGRKGSSRSKRSKDDLTQVEGIGPKIEELLNAAGYYTFADIADAKPSDLRTILREAGNRFKMHDTGSWPKQARLARDDDWDKLEALQDKLKGGK